MADIVDRATRSRMMSGIGGKNTKPELTVRRFLHRSGLRYRLHRTELPGRPDIVLASYRAVVLVHGCFWHRHAACPFAYSPRSNQAFWNKKFQENVRRDARNIRALRRLGWICFVIWECDLSAVRLERLARNIRAARGQPHSSRRSTACHSTAPTISSP